MYKLVLRLLKISLQRKAFLLLQGGLRQELQVEVRQEEARKQSAQNRKTIFDKNWVRPERKWVRKWTSERSILQRRNRRRRRRLEARSDRHRHVVRLRSGRTNM